MIIIKIKGGLGNQLFQYSLGRYLNILNKVEVKLDNGLNTNTNDTVRQYEINKFNITLPLASETEVKQIKYPWKIFSKIWRGVKAKIFRIHHIGFEPSILKVKKGYLDGYWQSYKYLEPIRDILLQEISLKNPLENKYSELLNIIQSSNSVSIHIRCGDYITDKKTHKAHYICTKEYYDRAIKVIKEKVINPEFYIFSDDINWARENLQTSSPTYFVSNQNTTNYEELILMSKCKHNIIANSSFSFWGAWLNQNSDKIVLAPQKWNNKYSQAYKDLLPIEWIPV